MIEPTQTDVTSLGLMQLEYPEPVSMLPDTLAWKVLWGLLVAAAVLFLWRRYQAYRQAMWKRQAHALALEAKGLAQADPWFTLIKRVYLVHHSRAELLKLCDAQLLVLLPCLTGHVCDTLIERHYQSKGRISEADNDALYGAFTRWLDSLPVDAKVEHKIQEKTDV